MVAADKFPPFRADVSVLFFKELVSRGHSFHWLLQSEGSCDKSYKTTWSGSEIWVGATDNGNSYINRLRKNCFSIINDVRMFILIHKNKYHILQVKDKFVSALLGIICAKISGSKFIYWLSFPFPEAW